MVRKSKKVPLPSGGKAGRGPKSSPEVPRPALLDADKLQQLYVTMLRCRMIAEKAGLSVKEGKFPADIASGHEAAAVGALSNLLAEDCVACGHSDFIARFIRGVPLKLIFFQLYARQAGTEERWLVSARRRASAVMIAPGFTPSAQLNLVTGVAWAHKMRKSPSVAVAFSGHDSVSLGFWRQAVRFSAVYQLPIVHVVENDAGDESLSARLRAPAEPSYGLPTFIVDGNDVVAVYRVAQEAIWRARQGHGPALIECQTCRWSIRSQTDSFTRHPAIGERDSLADPISRMEMYLEQKRLWSEKWKRRLMESFNGQMDKAAAFAERSSKPSAHADDETSSSLATAS